MSFNEETQAIKNKMEQNKAQYDFSFIIGKC